MGFEEGAAGRVLRRAEELGDRRRLDEFAVAHDGDTVGELGYDGQVVRDEEAGEAKLVDEPLDEREHLRLHGHVER